MKPVSQFPLYGALFFFAWPLLAGSAAATAQDGTAGPVGEQEARRIVREGIAIEFEMEPVTSGAGAAETLREGDLATFRFRITDTHTGTPLSGVYPAAWMDRKPEEEPKEPQTCQKKVEAFIGGSLLSPPELDLNVYYVLAMNDDASISVVDPLFGFGSTRLLDMVFLQSPGEDWALTDDQRTLYVSMPDCGRVAVAELASWEVVTNLDVGPHPSRVALQPDERYLWVGYDAPGAGSELSGVTVLDTQGPAVVKNIPTGRGHHEIAFTEDDRYAFVTNGEDGTLSVIDIGKLEKIKDVPVGKDPVSVAFSTLSDAAYVVSRGDGTIVAVDGKSHEVITRIRAEPGLGPIHFAPGDRLAFVVNPERDLVHILDAAVHRIIQTGDVEDGPDQVAFSDELAYVRHRGTETVLMIPLDQVGVEGRPLPVIDFPGGQQPFGRASRPSPAAGIVQAPGATAVLVANPADKAIYFYKEGMAAPMGHFQNYDRQPRAVLAVDRSLEETTPGCYETVATLRRSGLYDVAFFLDSPRTVHCFEVEVAPSPKLEAARAARRPVDVKPVFEARGLEVGDRIALRFLLSDPATAKPRSNIEDVEVLTFRAPGRDQQRQRATEVGGGIYEVPFEPSRSGAYYVFLASPSIRLEYNESPFLILNVREKSAEDPGAEAKEASQTR